MPHPGYLLLEDTDPGELEYLILPEWLLLENGGTDRLLLEAYYEKSVSERMSLAWAAPLDDSNVLNMEWSTPFVVSEQIPFHWEGTKELSLILGLPTGWSGIVSDSKTMSFGWAGVVAENRTLPFLIGTPAFGSSEVAPFAFRGNMITSRSMAVAWSGNASMSERAPLMVAVSVFSKDRVPYEWTGYGTVRSFWGMPLVTYKEIEHGDIAQFTFGGLFEIADQLPFEFTRGADLRENLPVAWGRFVSAERDADQIPFYPRLEVDGNEIVPVAFGASPSQGIGEEVPIVTLASVLGDSRLNVEWRGYVENTEELPLHIRGKLAALAEIPYDFATKALTGEPIPLATIQGILSGMELPLEVWVEGSVLFVEGVDCTWVIRALPPSSDNWPIEGCDDGETP